MIKAYLGSLLLISLIGCSSTVEPPIKRYLMQSDLAKKSERSFNDFSLKVELAQYIDDYQLLSQDGNEVFMAHYHRWAEPVKVNIKRIIRHHLNMSDDKLKPHLQGGDVYVFFEQFHGSVLGQVYVSGDILIKNAKGDILLSQSFNLNSQQDEVGYAALVFELEKQSNLLAKNIISSLSKI